MNKSIYLFLALLALGLAACSGSTSQPEVQEPAAITPAPLSGAPGTILGLDSPALGNLPAGGVLTALIDTLQAPVSLSATGQAVAIVPLAAAGPAGVTPPADPVAITLLLDGEVIARSEAAFTIGSLTPAPAATDSLAASLASVNTSLRTIVTALEPEPSPTAGYALSVLAACDSLFNGEGTGSLTATLQDLAATDPESKELVDAFIASTGILEATQDLAGSLAQVAYGSRLVGRATKDDSGPSEHPFLATTTDTIPINDVLLARKMQFQVLLKLFGETVINETAEEYALYVGLVSGAIGIGHGVPGTAVISAIISVADFAVNKVLVGLFPSEVTDFTLTLEDADLQLGETTTARLDLVARNTPPGVGIQDFVGLTLNLLGLGPSSSASFRDILENTAAYFLSTIQGLLSAYSNAHPELNMDVSFAVVPEMTWHAVIHDTRLVELQTFTPNIITGLEGEANWRAGGPSIGEGRIYARTATGEGSLLIDPLPGFTYTGGAFGESVISTETVSVQVTSDLYLAVDFAPIIAQDGSNVLEVVAGYYDDQHQPLPVPGIQVDLIVDGGSVQETSGVTDADGSFITLAQLDQGSERIIITVTVSDAALNQLVQTMQADLASGGAVFGLIAGGTGIQTSGGAGGCGGGESDGDAEDVEITTSGPFSQSGEASSTGTCPDGTSGGSGQSDANLSGNLSIDSGSGVVVLSGSFASNIAGSTFGTDTQAYGRGYARSSVFMTFEIVDPNDYFAKDAGYSFTLTGSMTGGATGYDSRSTAYVTLSGDGIHQTYGAGEWAGHGPGTPEASVDESGFLLPGIYTISVTCSGSGTARNPDPLSVSANQTVEFTFTLTPP